MAVDTRNKRAAAIGLGRPGLTVWPDPDGSLGNQADRQHMGYAYLGILVGTEQPVLMVLRVPVYTHMGRGTRSR